MGVTLGYCLAKAGVPVTIYEASATLGGLAGPLTLPDGVEVDCFYHAVLQSDDHLLSLCDELGLGDRRRFSPTGSAVYAAGHTHPMNGVADFLRLPLLNPLERLRLGLTIRGRAARGYGGPRVGADPRVAGQDRRRGGLQEVLGADAPREVRRRCRRDARDVDVVACRSHAIDPVGAHGNS